MKANILINDNNFIVDLSKPLDISLPLMASKENPLAWHLEQPEIYPVKVDHWVGKVSEGASVNFNNIVFNPHAHGTHTECVGHISEAFHSINETLKCYFFTSEVISIEPEIREDDAILTVSQIKKALKGKSPQAVIIRTLPNTSAKKSKKYSNTNWPYLERAAAVYLHDIGVMHLLIDLPSVDKEMDDGKVEAHRAFWNYPKAPRFDATITEFIFVPNHVKDGSYLLNLQVAPFHNDASPSRPVLYSFQ